MTPTKPVATDVSKPADSAAGDSTGLLQQRERGQRAARKRPKLAGKPRSEDKSALLEWAYTEYHRLREQGQTPNIPQFSARFPTCRSSLREILQFEACAAFILDSDPVLGRPTPSSSGDESIQWPIAGEKREDFTILRELARGAIARVYLAAEESTGGRLVVLKCSRQGAAEARTMGRLTHPNIVPILSARTDEQAGLTLVCMPYLGCATLEDAYDRFWAAAAALPPSKADFFLEVIRFRAQPEDPPPLAIDPRLLQGTYTDGVIHLAAQLAETLAFLHQHSVSHRDLKPSNVLLDSSGKPLLLDFNLSGNEHEKVVLVGGTLRYMPPEQIRAYLARCKDGMDERVDLYALGVMVYELLGGVHPCATLLDSPVSRLQAESMPVGLKAGFRPFREVCPELARPVAAVLDRCVALDAADRPASAAELATELKRQFAPAWRLRRWITSHRHLLLTTLGLLLMAVAVLASFWAVMPSYSEREYDRGRIAYQAGDFASAEDHFDKAWRADANNPRFRFARGCARLQQSKILPKERVRFDLIWEDLVPMERGAADAQSLAVNAYFQLRKQNFDDAIAMYSNPVMSGYRPLMVLNNRAYAYMSTRRWQKAQLDLDKAVELAPKCQAVRYNRALVGLRMRLQRKIRSIPSSALDDIEQVLPSGSKNSSVYGDAAVLYAQAAQDENRPEHLELALSYLRQAIAAGENPAQFEPFPVLRAALKRPDFTPLLGNRPSERAPKAELRLLDPVDLPD
jgi:serine/threonine protein kinase/Flp pilus assembly protein TadD